jgi:hypothetical protein
MEETARDLILDVDLSALVDAKNIRPHVRQTNDETAEQNLGEWTAPHKATESLLKNILAIYY